MMIAPLKFGLYRFSATAITAKTYAKFQEKYQANVAAFQKKTFQQETLTQNIKKSTRKTYIHPIDSSHKKIFPTHTKTQEIGRQFWGAEQVSPHYENFGMARRHALTFWAGYFILRFIASTPDIHFYAEASVGAWMFVWAYLYFWTEGKKSYAMPMLNRFYRQITGLEVGNLYNHHKENSESSTRQLMRLAKSQVEYKLVHNEYISVRNNILLNFLINEQIALKNHLNDRAINILQQAEAAEEMNQNKIISAVMEETRNSIDNAYKQNKDQIEKEMFRLALDGIANGKMDYSNDPILPYVVATIQKTVEKFQKISPEDQSKMVKLTNQQMEAIRSSDARLRDQFLQNEPKIDGSLKNNEIIGRLLQKWGK